MLAKYRKQHQEQRLDAMQSTRKTALAQHFGHVTLAGQQTASMSVIAAEVQHGDDGSGHHLRITHLTLSIFVMMNCFQQSSTRQKTAAIWLLMSFPCELISLVTVNFTRKLMDFHLR